MKLRVLTSILSLCCMICCLAPGQSRADDEQAAPVADGAVALAETGGLAPAADNTVAVLEPETPAEAAMEFPAPAPKPGILNGFELTGYVRHYMSFNLNNVPETAGNDAGKMSMNRLSLLTQLKGPIGPANLTLIGRLSREQMTSYLKDLQSLARQTSPQTDFASKYDENEIREFYLDMPIGDRIKLRVGKQQVVWGETDFFQAMDVVHGYDYSWRSFLEPENEEWRKPLILGNAQIAVPELRGNLQLLVRPGLDRARDVGNTFDMFGGRWAQNGSRGFNLNDNNVALTHFELPVDFHHKDGDTDKAHYGGRWMGTIGANKDLAYSLNYYHTQAQNPVVFQDPTAPIGLAFIFPTIDIYGGTLSGKIPLDFLDTIFRAEVAYVPNQPLNNAALDVVKKDAVRSMFGLDTNLRLERILGTCNASMLSLQIFDTFITDYKASQQINTAFGSRQKEHETLLTGIFTLPYASDSIRGQLVAVQDLSSNGGIVAPSIEFMMGPSWRVKLEGDIFYGGKRNDAGNQASMFGSFAHSSQVMSRVTYQF